MGTHWTLFDDVEKVLAKTARFPFRKRQVHDPRALVDGVIEFANVGSLRALAGQSLFPISGIPMPNGPVGNPQWQALADDLAKRDYVSEREQLRADLFVITAETDDNGALTSMRERLVHTGRLLQVLEPRGGHYVVSQLTAPLAYATHLMLDGPFAGLLCRCRYDACEAPFFLYKPARGRPLRLHCSPKHGELDHDRRRGERPRTARKPLGRRHR